MHFNWITGGGVAIAAAATELRVCSRKYTAGFETFSKMHLNSWIDTGAAEAMKIGLGQTVYKKAFLHLIIEKSPKTKQK